MLVGRVGYGYWNHIIIRTHTLANNFPRKLVLMRTAGHGFLEFVGSYTLQPQANGATYLQYMVELVPCPIFPLPIVETKIRKEVPKMLLAVRDAARRREP